MGGTISTGFSLRRFGLNAGITPTPYAQAAGLTFPSSVYGTPAPSTLPNLSTASTLRSLSVPTAKAASSGFKFGGRWGFNTDDILGKAPLTPPGSPATLGGGKTPTKWSLDNKLGAVGLGINAVNALAGIVGLGYNIYATGEQLKMARENQKLARQQFETENARYNARENERIQANKQIAAAALDSPMQRE